MNKISIYAALAALVCVAGVLFFFNTKRTNAHAHYHVAIIQPISHPALDEIVGAFKETIAKQCPEVAFELYNAAGNRMIMQSKINELMHSDLTALVTLGTDATTLAIGYGLERQSEMPIFFMAAEPTEELLRYPYLTGVRSDFDVSNYCTAYMTLFPERKKIVLVYDPTIKAGLNEQDAQGCQKFLQAHGFTVEAVTIDRASSLYTRALSSIDRFHPDTIMILMDNNVVSGIDSLVKLCSDHKILLYAADHNSAMRGAGAAYGHTESLFGSIAASQVCDFVQSKNKVMPPIEKINSSFVLLNQKHLAQQNVSIHDALRARLETIGGKLV